jgi:hypothetical protein
VFFNAFKDEVKRQFSLRASKRQRVNERRPIIYDTGGDDEH